MRIKNISHVEVGFQVVVEERSAIGDRGSYLRKTPSPRQRQLACKIKPPVTRLCELVSVDRKVFVGGLAIMQFSWKWV